MRIGIFGGTFNPPHLGHIVLAETALKEATLSKVIFIPCGNPPHKNNHNIADAMHRFEMTRLAISPFESFEISDIEVSSSEKSYTAKTLTLLKDRFSENDTLCFIVGADSFCQMESWYCPEQIFEKAEIVIALRGGYANANVHNFIAKYRDKYNARMSTISMPLLEISSTDIRNKIRSGEDFHHLLPSSVCRYIEENNVYGE